MYGNNHILHSGCNRQPLFLYIPQPQAKYRPRMVSFVFIFREDSAGCGGVIYY
jgi:hypothetical protein